MKKFLSIILSLTMLMSASITMVFAEDTVPEVSSASVTKVEAEDTGKTVDTTTTGVSAVQLSKNPVFTVNCTEPGAYKLTIRIWDKYGDSRSTSVQIGTAEAVTYKIDTAYQKYIDYSVCAELTMGSNAIKISGNSNSYIDYIELEKAASVSSSKIYSINAKELSSSTTTYTPSNKSGTGVKFVNHPVTDVISCETDGVYKMNVKIASSSSNKRSVKYSINGSDAVTLTVTTTYNYEAFDIYLTMDAGEAYEIVWTTTYNDACLGDITIAPVAAVPTAADESMRIEAETKGTSSSGSYAGYVNFGNTNPTFSVYAAEAGTYKLMIPFKDNYDASRSFKVSVNGGEAISGTVVTLAEITSSYAVTDIELAAGENSIVLDLDYHNYIDYIELSKSAPEFPEATKALNVNKPVFSARKTMVGSDDGVTFIKKVSTLDEAKEYYDTSASDEYKNMIYVSSPVSYKNNSGEESYELIVGAYEANKKLSAVVANTNTIRTSKNGSYNHLREAAIAVTSDIISVKAFSWDSLSNLEPYCEAAEIK